MRSMSEVYIDNPRENIISIAIRRADNLPCAELQIDGMIPSKICAWYYIVLLRIYSAIFIDSFSALSLSIALSILWISFVLKLSEATQTQAHSHIHHHRSPN